MLVGIRAYLDNGDPESIAIATELLQRCRRYAESINSKRCLIEIGCLEALLQFATDDVEAALTDLQNCILLAEPAGAWRIVAEAGPSLAPLLQTLIARDIAAKTSRQILGALGSAPPAQPAPPAIPGNVLTERESDVIFYIAQRMSDKEIAQILHVSVRTIHKHSRNIYQKLHVSSRREAVIAARAAGILPSSRNN